MLKLAIAFALIATPTFAACYKRDHLSAFLEFKHSLKLKSWGLNDAGEMEELFMSDAGNWAVVVTKVNKCSDILSFPRKERGRLWAPPLGNDVLPEDWRLDKGSPV